MNNTLNEVQKLALTKVELPVDRKQVAVGTHSVDFLVRIHGALKVGADFEQRQVASAEPWKLLAIALSKLNGVTVESLVREAEEGTLDGEDIKAAAAKAIQAIKEDTWRPCKGKVTAALVVEAVPVVTPDQQTTPSAGVA